MLTLLRFHIDEKGSTILWFYADGWLAGWLDAHWKNMASTKSGWLITTARSSKCLRIGTSDGESKRILQHFRALQILRSAFLCTANFCRVSSFFPKRWQSGFMKSNSGRCMCVRSVGVWKSFPAWYSRTNEKARPGGSELIVRPRKNSYPFVSVFILTHFLFQNRSLVDFEIGNERKSHNIASTKTYIFKNFPAARA